RDFDAAAGPLEFRRASAEFAARLQNIGVGSGPVECVPIFTSLKRLITLSLADDNVRVSLRYREAFVRLKRPGVLNFVLARSERCRALAFCARRPQAGPRQEDPGLRALPVADGTALLGRRREAHGDEELVHVLQSLLSSACDLERRRRSDPPQETAPQERPRGGVSDERRDPTVIIAPVIDSLKLLVRSPDRVDLAPLWSVLLSHKRQPPELVRGASPPPAPRDSEPPDGGSEGAPRRRSVLDALAGLLTSEASDKSTAVRWSVVQFLCEACCLYADAPTVLLRCDGVGGFANALFPRLSLMLQKAMRQHDDVVQQEEAECLSARGGRPVGELLRGNHAASVAHEAATLRLAGAFGRWDASSCDSAKRTGP
ncbi:MAG: hypothetical protein BJ554DRAFT_191, partial [Olpidium bornovanus]